MDQANFPAALDQILQIAVQTRLQELTARLAKELHWTVQSGPFARMVLSSETSWHGGDIGAKLLGCYEAELHPYIERAIQRNPDVVVNVGCAEGYYAIGLARRLPQARVYAFDIDPGAQAVCKRTAHRNNVADRVEVGGRCDEQQLVALGRAGKRVLIIMDCEGDELTLLTDAAGDALFGCDILVECHDFADRALTPTLAARLSRRHKVEHLREGARDPAAFPQTKSLGSFDRWLLVCEFRPEVMTWMACWSTNGESDAPRAAVERSAAGADSSPHQPSPIPLSKLEIAVSSKDVGRRIRLFESVFDAAEMASFSSFLGAKERFGTVNIRTTQDLRRDFSYYANTTFHDDELRDFVSKYYNLIQPVLQGPFPLSSTSVHNGPWDGYYKTVSFNALGINESVVSNAIVLDIGCNAGFDSIFFAMNGAAEVVGIEPGPFYNQAMFLATILCLSNLRYTRCGWQSLSPEAFGTFDIVNCQGIMYHEPDLIIFLERLYTMLRPNGRLILETHVTLENKMGARFIEGDFWGDNNWWWITDIDTTMALLRVTGFEDVENPQYNAVPSKNPANPLATVEGVPVGGRAFFTARRPEGPPRRKLR